MRNLVGVVVGLGLGVWQCPAQETYRLDPVTSLIEIHVDTAGALGFLGDTHLIQAPIAKGSFVFDAQDPGKSSVGLEVDAGSLRVIDLKRSAKDRDKIQAKMQSDRVLDVRRYRKIVFKSVKIIVLDTNRLQITGDLTIRDRTQPVVVEAVLEQEGEQMKAVGQSRLKQSRFGIRPVAAGLGTVRVKDELSLSFEVSGQRQGSGDAAGR